MALVRLAQGASLFCRTWDRTANLLTMTRFFAATVLGGRLHVDGIPDWGHWWPEDHPYLILSTTTERKVRALEELEATIEEPMGEAPTRNIWIHEGLGDEARRLWEQG